jgi:hypothetical protein
MIKALTRFILVFFFLCHYGQLYATDSVYLFKEARIKLSIPKSHWHLQPKQEKNGYIIYVFKRDPILDSSNRNIIPNAAVIIEKVDPKTDVVTYSVNKRANNGFSVMEMILPSEGRIDYANAVGYKGTYTDELSHTVYVVHAIHGDKGIQIILDTTTETFSSMDPEFLQILKSIKNL